MQISFSFLIEDKPSFRDIDNLHCLRSSICYNVVFVIISLITKINV